MPRQFILLGLMLILVLPVIAQENEAETFNRLPEILQHVPDTVAARQWFTFADYEAMTLARPNAERPENYEAFESDLAPYQFWWAAFMGIRSGVSLDFARVWWEDGARLNGFTFFDMDVSVEYGMPPENVQMFWADYDPDTVIAAHAEREYTVESTDTYQLLCSPDGCDAGQIQNLPEREPGYIFGGHLGRKQPVLLYDDHIILSSPHLPAVEAHQDVMRGATPSLADDADYLALAEAAGFEVEVVIQGYMLPVSVIATTEDFVSATLGMRATAQQRDALIEELGFDDTNNALPAYTVFAIVDAATETEQVVRVLLPYSNEGDAEIATTETMSRLENMTSIATRRPYTEVLQDRNATLTSRVIAIAEQDRFVAVLEFRAPLPTTLENEDGLLNASRELYRILPQMILSRDTLWLAPNLPSTNE